MKKYEKVHTDSAVMKKEEKGIIIYQNIKEDWKIVSENCHLWIKETE